MLQKITAMFLVFSFATMTVVSWAQQEFDKTVGLKERIEDSIALDGLEPEFNELINIYSKDERIGEFYSFLESLEKRGIFKKAPILYYYKALVRFKQMQFLEKNEMWEELFENKDSYLEDLDGSLEKVRELSAASTSIVLRSKLLEWKMGKDEEKVQFDVLEELYDLSQELSEAGTEIGALKDVADELFKEEESNYAKKLYNLYVSGISKTDIDDQELKSLADGFLEEDKIGLSVSLYTVYLDRLSKTQKDKNVIVKTMLETAEMFVHSGWQEGSDPFYAEDIYSKLEGLYKAEAQESDTFSQYRRAYNLEKIKEYDSCFREYLKLVNNFDDYQDKDRIYFRLGILSAYIFNKREQAIGFFSKVTSDFSKSQDYLNSLYHLGLLNHWQGNLEKAEGFYNKILENTKQLQEDPEIATLAGYRLEEIEENKDIEYNLRMFLQATLEKEEEPYIKLELFAKMPKGHLSQAIRYEVNSYLIDTGCLQQDYSYLWSGELGTNQNPLNKYELDTTYKDIGTKVVNVVLVGPTGIVDGTIEMADIYKSKL